MRKKVVLGKVAYVGSRKTNEVDIEYSLIDGRFSASGNIWQEDKKDSISSGQNLEEILSLFPGNELVERIVNVWRKWHLNNMQAGSPKQTAFLEALNLPNHNHYELAKEKLQEAGLDPDNSFAVDGKPYSYGSAWLAIEIPVDVVSEIESWPGDSLI